MITGIILLIIARFSQLALAGCILYILLTNPKVDKKELAGKTFIEKMKYMNSKSSDPKKRAMAAKLAPLFLFLFLVLD